MPLTPPEPPSPSAPAPRSADRVLAADVMQRLNFPETFGNSLPVEVELGAGDGSFLAARAAAVRDRNFLGVERLLGRLRKLDRKANRAGLDNVRCLRIEAAYFLEWMLSPGTVSTLHVYFPDPWPKRRHWKRRLINERFAELAHLALAPGGEVFLRTDHTGYFEAMEPVFANHTGFERIATPPDLAAVLTDFEREFHAQGIPTHHAAYRKKVS
ncbi:MAG: tRNA (guanosine(46)-N7)-methyltransferase TrmB [Verrucomicrobiota bacterium]